MVSHLLQIMKTLVFISIALCLAVLAGCSKDARSVSNSGYREVSHPAYGPSPSVHSDPAFEYRGELSEFDVLGITRDASATEADIERALAGAKPIRLKPGASVLLIQSGAMFPDGPMVNELSKQFRVVPFSGVP